MDNIYQNYYDNFGNLRIIISNDNQYYYDYDFAKRLINYKENLLEIHYKYNSLNNLVDKKINFNNQNYVSTYEYDEEDNIIKFTNDIVINNTFDKLGRLNKKQCDNYIINYNYKTNGNRTSTLIDKVNDNFNNFEYKYNKLGNIIEINQNNNITNYFYDEYNQLIKEIKNNTTILYTYDNFGNVLNKKTYQNDLLIKTDNYTYNTNWLDQLNSYNDILITYDNIGNPITIGTNNLSWTNGRQLKSYTNEDLIVSYKYNKEGIRTSKIVNGVKYDYYLEGNKILFRQNDINMIYFIRDENENLIGFKYNNVLYYYIKNIQEDILGIQNSNSEQIVTYEYDSYGKVISIRDNNHNEITDINNIAYINPFRYRSYYYDNETKLYYLNSRYYNPTWGRFINADAVIDANKDIIGNNLYNYSGNGFINRIDMEGNAWWWLAGAIIGGAVGFATKLVSNAINKKPFFDGTLGAFVGGATTGLLLTTSFNPIAAYYAGAAAESIVNEGEKYITNKKQLTTTNVVESISNVSKDTVINGTIGNITGKMGGKTVKINKGWYTPQKFVSSFTGTYARKTIAQNSIQGLYQLGIEKIVLPTTVEAPTEPLLPYHDIERQWCPVR